MSETLAVVRASRPNFLLLAPLCAGLGLAVAWQQGQAPELLHTFLVFLGAVLAHAAVNLLNEYDDFRSGLDMITERTPFSGGSGALPEVPTAARRVLWAGLGTLAVVVTIGLYFLWLRGLPPLDYPLPDTVPAGTGHGVWPHHGAGHRYRAWGKHR